MRNETTQNMIQSHAHKAKLPTMQYGRVARVCVSYVQVGVVSRLQEIGGRSELKSAVYPYEVSRQIPQLSVGTGLGPDQLSRSCV